MTISVSQTDPSLNLASAMVVSSVVPLLLFDGDLRVIAASLSFCHAFELSPSNVRFRRLAELGGGEWNVPQIHALLGATLSGHASVQAYEMDVEIGDRPPHHLVLNAHKLEHADRELLLLTISDQTEERLADKLRDDLVREKGILLQELQHRIANSLQIIASILLQSARKMQTDESRLHLHSAHNRVLSIAAVQQHLAASRHGDIELGPYFKQLCDSLGASMIRDPNQVQILVSADAGTVKASASVCLGLIVTELVINALKYAFPAERAGTIVVHHKMHGADWTLSVNDNGVGMSVKTPKPGLGTSIVEALAKQLGACIDVIDARPGTSISIVHIEARAIPRLRAL